MKIVLEEGEIANITDYNGGNQSDYVERATTIVPISTTNNKFKPPVPVNNTRLEDENKNYRQSNSNRNVQISGFVKSQK